MIRTLLKLPQRSGAHLRLTACASLLTLGALALPAHAGYWVFDGYDYQHRSRRDFQSWSTQLFEGIEYQPLNDNDFWGDGDGFYPAGQYTPFSLGGSEFFNSHEGQIAPFTPRYNKNILTVTPMFHWESNQINGQDDPTDNPPARLWYWVKSSVSLYRYHYIYNQNQPYYSSTNPYTGAHYQIMEFNNGIGSDQIPPPTIDPAYPASPIGSISDFAEGSKMEVVDTYGEKVVHGTTRTLTVAVKSTSLAHQSSHYEGIRADSGANFEVQMMSFRLAGRMTWLHYDTDLQTDFSFDTPYPSMSVAAGGLSTNLLEHEGDIALRATRPGAFGAPTAVKNLPRKKLPRLQIQGREGKAIHTRVLQSSPNATTDADGRIFMGILDSRDRINEGTSTTGVYLGRSPATPGLGVNQRWPDVEWKMGVSGDEEWNPGFFVGNGYQVQWIHAKSFLHRDLEHPENNIPLTQHKMKFIVTHMEVREKDENDRWVERLYTSDPNQNISPSSSVQLIYQRDIDASKYLTFDPSVVSDRLTPGANPGVYTDGVYKTKVTLKGDPMCLLKSVVIGIEDQGVYEVGAH